MPHRQRFIGVDLQKDGCYYKASASCGTKREEIRNIPTQGVAAFCHDAMTFNLSPRTHYLNFARSTWAPFIDVIKEVLFLACHDTAAAHPYNIISATCPEKLEAVQSQCLRGHLVCALTIVCSECVQRSMSGMQRSFEELKAVLKAYALSLGNCEAHLRPGVGPDWLMQIVQRIKPWDAKPGLNIILGGQETEVGPGAAAIGGAAGAALDAAPALGAHAGLLQPDAAAPVAESAAHTAVPLDRAATAASAGSAANHADANAINFGAPEGKDRDAGAQVEAPRAEQLQEAEDWLRFLKTQERWCLQRGAQARAALKRAQDDLRQAGFVVQALLHDAAQLDHGDAARQVRAAREWRLYMRMTAWQRAGAVPAEDAIREELQHDIALQQKKCDALRSAMAEGQGPAKRARVSGP